MPVIVSEWLAAFSHTSERCVINYSIPWISSVTGFRLRCLLSVLLSLEICIGNVGHVLDDIHKQYAYEFYYLYYPKPGF